MGLGAGGGAAFAVHALRGPAEPAPKAAPPDESAETAFVPLGPILTPLVFPDGSLVGYASIEVQLEVPASEVEAVKQRSPLLLHALNLQTYRSPLAAGPDGSLPDLSRFRGMVAGAAPKVFGPGVVRQVAITQARPA